MFAAKAGELSVAARTGRVTGAVLGIGHDSSPFVFGNLPLQLPGDCSWRLVGECGAATATLGYFLGAHVLARFVSGGQKPALLFVPPDHESSLSQASATWMVRDLINTPANLLGPVELADFAVYRSRSRYGAVGRNAGEPALGEGFPTIAEGRPRFDRPPRVVTFHCAATPRRTIRRCCRLCGEGLCFDPAVCLEAIGRHAADEEGHGRCCDRPGSGPFRRGGRPAHPSGGTRRMRGKFRLWHCDAGVRRLIRSPIRPDRRDRRHRRGGPAGLVRPSR